MTAILGRGEDVTHEVVAEDLRAAFAAAAAIDLGARRLTGQRVPAADGSGVGTAVTPPTTMIALVHRPPATVTTAATPITA